MFSIEMRAVLFRSEYATLPSARKPDRSKGEDSYGNFKERFRSSHSEGFESLHHTYARRA